MNFTTFITSKIVDLVNKQLKSKMIYGLDNGDEAGGTVDAYLEQTNNP